MKKNLKVIHRLSTGYPQVIHRLSTGYPQVFHCFATLLPLLFLAAKPVESEALLRLTPRPFLLQAESNLSSLALAQIALQLSARDGGRLLVRVEELMQELKALHHLQERQRGEELLVFLYRRVLRRYQADQSRMDVLLLKGVYNCVSSSLMYVILARDLGLDARVVGTSKHAFVLLRFGDNSWVDVETTNRYGFDPGSKKEFVDSFTQQTGFVYVPVKTYHDRRLVSDQEALSFMLQNQLFLMEQANYSFADFLPLMVDLFYLRPSLFNRNNLIETIVGTALDLEKKMGFSPVMSFLQQAIELYPAARLSTVRATFAYNRVVTLYNQDQLDAAAAVLNLYESEISQVGTLPKELKRQHPTLQAINKR